MKLAWLYPTKVRKQLQPNGLSQNAYIQILNPTWQTTL